MVIWMVQNFDAQTLCLVSLICVGEKGAMYHVDY